MKIVLIGLILFSGQAVAASLIVDVHGVSKHVGTTTEYNERNYGLGISRSSGNVVVSAGGYKNSLNRLSLDLSSTLQTPRIGPVRVGLEAGIVTGYAYSIAPLLVPVVRVYVHDRVSVNARYMPAIGGITPAVFSLSMGIAIK